MNNKYINSIIEAVIAVTAIIIAVIYGGSIVTTILIFIAILGLLVFVHELGHFVVAKRAGMKVDEFGFGFPPRLFGYKIGDTVYTINLIPLGGFVKIVGEDGSDPNDAKSFGNKPAWQRFAVLIAGVSMNAVLAWVLISIGMGWGLPTVLSETDILPASAKLRDVSIGILEVGPKTPGQEAGLKPGDFIVKIGDQNIGTITEAQEATKQAAGKPMKYTIKRGSESLEKTITPRESPPEGEGPLGVALGTVGLVSYPWYEAPIRGLTATVNVFILTVTTLASLLGQFLSGQPVAGVLAGPVGIAVLTRDVTQLGLIYLLQFTAVLSINLAIINVLPFPALDGGRILFLAIEKIRGKKMDVKTEGWANTIGFMVLILLMVAVTVKDVSRYSQGFKNLFQGLF